MFWSQLTDFVCICHVIYLSVNFSKKYQSFSFQFYVWTPSLKMSLICSYLLSVHKLVTLQSLVLSKKTIAEVKVLQICTSSIIRDWSLFWLIQIYKSAFHTYSFKNLDFYILVLMLPLRTYNICHIFCLCHQLLVSLFLLYNIKFLWKQKTPY